MDRLMAVEMNRLMEPVATATAALVRLDEKLGRSPVAAGWIERMHFQDSAAAMWLAGELVHLEDLVLHDAHMDIRAPTHELTRAHAILRARRQIADNLPGWALGASGMIKLVGRSAEPGSEPVHIEPEAISASEGSGLDFSEIDEVLARSTRLLEGQALEQKQKASRDPLVYDEEWNEGARLAEWRALVEDNSTLPPVLRAAVALDGWQTAGVLQHSDWMGALLSASLLRKEGLAEHHLPALAVGLRVVPRERRRAEERMDRVHALLAAMTQTAELGVKLHDRLMLAQAQLQRRLAARRHNSNSRLPKMVELALLSPLVTTNMIQRRLKTSRQGALDLVADLGLREITGRSRFQAWAVN